MRLDPTHPNNYNGFVHPDFLAHLKPHIQGMPVKINCVDVPNSSAFDWAELGILEEINLHHAHTTPEAMIIKGLGKQLANFIHDSNDADHSLDFLHDYYFSNPDRSLSILMEQLGTPKLLIQNLEVVASLCICDLGFTESRELESFLCRGHDADLRNRVNYSLYYHQLHYLRDPVDIKDWEMFAQSPFDWIKLASFQAHIGDYDSVRNSLDKAKRVAKHDFFAWQMISKNYLFLLGDFDLFWSAMEIQIECCEDTFSWLETVTDLCSYIGTDNALEKARDLLNLAEIASDDSDGYFMIAHAWEDYFNDLDRASRCRKIAGIYEKSKKV